MNINYKKIPYITAVLIAINTVIFLVVDFGMFGINEGMIFDKYSMYWPSVFMGKDYFRLVSSMFLHSGIEHLLNNMFMLGILGYEIEKTYGPIKFLITYFVCGIGGGVFSGVCSMRIDENVSSVGASGAIFGIFGLLLAMIFIERKRMGNINPTRLILLFILIIFGNMQPGVDWHAHLGGAVLGVVIGIILYRPKDGEKYLDL